MFKSVLLVLLTMFFVACTQSVNNIKLSEFSNSNVTKQNTFDSCTLDSYTAQINGKDYGKLFIEEINLQTNCSWNGLSRGFFEDLFKSTLKLNTMKVIERFDYKNQEFTTYLIDGKYYMNLIYTFFAFDDKFVVDYDGVYFTQEIKKFNPKYENQYLQKDRFISNYNDSLVNKNIINHYFNQEREDFEAK